MSEKRKVSTDALETLGTIITQGGRDAIHLAVEPIIAGERLKPGSNIGIRDGLAYNTGVSKFLGIVDPFLKQSVQIGEMFWLLVYPRQITSLRHVWSHPDFPIEERLTQIHLTEQELTIERAKQWIEDWANSLDQSYEYVMEIADSHQGNGYGDYIIEGGRFEGEATPDEFWDNYAIVKSIPNPHRTSFFSCSC